MGAMSSFTKLDMSMTADERGWRFKSVPDCEHTRRPVQVQSACVWCVFKARHIPKGNGEGLKGIDNVLILSHDDRHHLQNLEVVLERNHKSGAHLNKLYITYPNILLYKDHKPLVGLLGEIKGVPAMASDRIQHWLQMLGVIFLCWANGESTHNGAGHGSAEITWILRL